EARREEAPPVARREVRRRLDVHLGAEQEPGDRERAQRVVERGLGVLAHRDPRLREEGLDDDLLDVAVRLVQVEDRGARVYAPARRLADPDEDAGGERDREL